MTGTNMDSGKPALDTNSKTPDLDKNLPKKEDIIPQTGSESTEKIVKKYDDEPINGEEKPVIYDQVDNTNELDMFSSIVDEIQEEMPEPSEHVINSEPTPDETINNTSINTVNETAFDASIHRVDADGKPKLKKDGSFMIKPGKKAGSNTNKSFSTVGSIQQEPMFSQENNAMNEQNKSFSKIGALTATRIRQILGGENATKDELEYLESALKIYLDDSNFEVSPGIGLLMALGTFYLPLTMVPPEKNILMQTGMKLYYYIMGPNQVPKTEGE